MSNSVDPGKTAYMSCLIWIYAVCKSLLVSPVAVKELKKRTGSQRAPNLSFSVASNLEAGSKLLPLGPVSMQQKENILC